MSIPQPRLPAIVLEPQAPPAVRGHAPECAGAERGRLARAVCSLSDEL